MTHRHGAINPIEAGLPSENSHPLKHAKPNGFAGHSNSYGVNDLTDRYTLLVNKLLQETLNRLGLERFNRCQLITKL